MTVGFISLLSSVRDRYLSRGISGYYGGTVDILLMRLAGLSDPSVYPAGTDSFSFDPEIKYLMSEESS